VNRSQEIFSVPDNFF